MNGSAPRPNGRDIFKRTATCLAILSATAGILACGGTGGMGTLRKSGSTTQVETTPAPVVIIDAAGNPATSPSAPTPGTGVPGYFDGASTPEGTTSPTPGISITTGRELPYGRPFQPVLVVIDNAPHARPQAGLMDADIIYESSLDRTDHSTRLIALFSDNDPAMVGPIADARISFFYLRREWNAMLVYNGYPSDAGYPVYDQSTIDIPADYSPETAEYFVQDQTVSSDPRLTLFCKLTQMRQALYGVSDTAAVTGRFSHQQGVLPGSSKPYDKVGVPFTSSDFSKVEFVYHPEDNMIYRYERNSKGTLVPTKTLVPGPNGSGFAIEHLRVQNLIVQYVKYQDLAGPYRSAELISNGKCDYFINGHHVAGKWSRPTLGDPTEYTLRDGTPLVLEPGTTWIVFQTLQREVKIHYA